MILEEKKYDQQNTILNTMKDVSRKIRRGKGNKIS